MAGDDDPACLSVGIVYSDSEHGPPWESALKSLGRSVIERRAHVSSPLNVNVVFHVAGRMLTPEFEGVRTGRFSRRAMHLMVQCAVFPGPHDDPPAQARALLLDAIAEAERWAAKRKIADDLNSLRSLVAPV